MKPRTLKWVVLLTTLLGCQSDPPTSVAPSDGGVADASALPPVDGGVTDAGRDAGAAADAGPAPRATCEVADDVTEVGVRTLDGNLAITERMGTCNAGNEYEGTGCERGPELVYRYTPTRDVLLQVLAPGYALHVYARRACEDASSEVVSCRQNLFLRGGEQVFLFVESVGGCYASLGFTLIEHPVAADGETCAKEGWDMRCGRGLSCHDDTDGQRCRVPTCGDGALAPTEECDDGNLVSGDACSADCSATSAVTTAAEGCADASAITLPQVRIPLVGGGFYTASFAGDTTANHADVTTACPATSGTADEVFAIDVPVAGELAVLVAATGWLPSVALVRAEQSACNGTTLACVDPRMDESIQVTPGRYFLIVQGHSGLSPNEGAYEIQLLLAPS